MKHMRSITKAFHSIDIRKKKIAIKVQSKFLVFHIFKRKMKSLMYLFECLTIFIKKAFFVFYLTRIQVCSNEKPLKNFYFMKTVQL